MKNRKVADIESLYSLGRSEPQEKLVQQIDENKMEDNDIGFVVDSSPETQRDGVDKYILQDLQANRFEVKIPIEYYYTEGDAVLERHVYTHQCLTCKNDMLYDEKEDEWYCPLKHDN